MTANVNFLVVEDRSTDADLMRHVIREEWPEHAWRLVDNKAGLLAALEDFSPDVVLSDLRLPAFNGIDALALVREARPSLPVIFVSGAIGEEKAIDLVHLGAADLVLKDHLVRLVPAVHRALQIEELRREKQAADERYKRLFDKAILGVYQVSPAGKFLVANQALAEFYGYESPEALISTITDIGTQLYVRPAEFLEKIATLERAGELHGWQVENIRKDGTRFWLSMDVRVVRDPQGNILHYAGFAQDITLRKVTEAALEASQSQLLEASRRAGMAEVATNVLHNVGNVLTSVNVSISLMRDRLRNSRLPNLTRATGLLREEEGPPSSEAPVEGRRGEVIRYLRNLAANLVEEQASLLSEVESLVANIAHITSITSMQQRYVTLYGVVETVSLEELTEDALRINAAALVRHAVEVERQYTPVPLLMTERHGVLQVLVNLISNAKYALDARKDSRRMTLRIALAEPGYVTVAVADNGSGIPPENLTKIFEPGFTSRPDGHGFGLHSGALMARQIGGTLTAASDGPGCGATFTLRLPLPPPTQQTTPMTKRVPFITPRVRGRAQP